MNLRPWLTGFAFLVGYSLFGQGSVNLSGRVIGDDYKPLTNATIYVSGFNNGVSTDETGAFILKLPKGMQEIGFSYIGFEAVKLELSLTRDTTIEVMLKTKAWLNEITIADKKVIQSISQTSEGNFEIQKQNITMLPNVMGQADPVRAIQMLPGVQSGNEGVSGIFIRGGSPDQNLIMLDGATVFNPSHLYGFLSVFNADAIGSVSVYKNSYPARFGGRLSSVINLHSAEGDTGQIKGSASIGAVISNLHLEGPFKNRKTTFTISARGCYVGLITSLVSHIQFKKAGYSGGISYYFYDLNGGITHRFNDKNTMSFTFFFNNDLYSFTNGSSYQGIDVNQVYKLTRKLNWQNAVAALNFQSKFNKSLSLTQSVTFTNYTLATDINSSNIYKEIGYEWDQINNQHTVSYVDEVSSKTELQVKPSETHTFRGGVELTVRHFQTGKGSVYDFTTNSDTSMSFFKASPINAADLSAFVEYDFHPSEKIDVDVGLRFNDYWVQHKNYTAFVPRINAVYMPIRFFGMRAAFASGYQNIHMLSSGQTSITLDYWLPCTAKIAPQQGWQLSGGLIGKLGKMFEWSFDAFYKRMSNELYFKEGSSFGTSGKDWESTVWDGGKGKCYGTEFYFAKPIGNITAQATYTLAWSTLKFRELNDGMPFPYHYDRRHNIALMLNYKINKHWEIGATWVYGSGNMYSIPVQYIDSWNSVAIVNYNKQGNPNFKPAPIELFTQYSGFNSYRLPAYHHLDLTATHRWTKKKTEQAVNLTIYNVYSRQNIFSVFLEYHMNNDGTHSYLLKQVSIFPILPSITYTVNFS